MKIFSDSANLKDIESNLRRGFISGITTNPSILSKEPKTDFVKHIIKITDLCNKHGSIVPLSVEVFTSNTNKMVEQALELVEKIIKMVDQSEYKRQQAAPGIKITSKNFGRDRRMPISNRFRIN